MKSPHSGDIRISCAAGAARIDIEGVIGVPEWEQFSTPGDRISTYAAFKDRIAEIGRLKADEVVVDIRSAGGSVNDALLIYEALCDLEARVVTRCHGCVASAATLIAQAASPGCRLVSDNTLYLVHNSSTEAQGNLNDLERTADLLRKTDRRIASIYARHSDRTPEYYLGLMDREHGQGEWLSPREALEAGLADRIFSSGKQSRKAVLDLAAPWLERGDYPALPPDKAAPGNPFRRLLSQLGELFDLLVAPLPETAGPAEKGVPTDETAPWEKEWETFRRRALPTDTLPREDPDPAEPETPAEPNRLSYEADARLFREPF